MLLIHTISKTNDAQLSYHKVRTSYLWFIHSFVINIANITRISCAWYNSDIENIYGVQVLVKYLRHVIPKWIVGSYYNWFLSNFSLKTYLDIILIWIIWPSLSPPQQTVLYRLQLREILFVSFFFVLYQQQFPAVSCRRLGSVRFYFLLFKSQGLFTLKNSTCTYDQTYVVSCAAIACIASLRRDSSFVVA